jgi:hypothetical protein
MLCFSISESNHSHPHARFLWEIHTTYVLVNIHGILERVPTPIRGALVMTAFGIMLGYAAERALINNPTSHTKIHCSFTDLPCSRFPTQVVSIGDSCLEVRVTHVLWNLSLAQDN